jgi:hypothetical protein
MQKLKISSYLIIKLYAELNKNSPLKNTLKKDYPKVFGVQRDKLSFEDWADLNRYKPKIYEDEDNNEVFYTKVEYSYNKYLKE